MAARRDYQEECVAANLRCYREGDRSLLDWLATGAGKTEIGIWTMEDLRRLCGGRILIIAHQNQLVNQTAERYERRIGRSVGILTGETKRYLSSDVLVASKDSLHERRLLEIDPSDFCGLLIDEAHRASDRNKSYRRVTEHMRQNPELLKLGLTATANRTDGHKLIGPGREFERLAYSYPFWDPSGVQRNAIDDGWLVPIIQKHVKVMGLDYGQIKAATNKDWTDRDIENYLLSEGGERVAGMVDAGVRVVGARPSVWFWPTVKLAQIAEELINRRHGRGIACGRAATIHGGTHEDRRRAIINAMSAGGIQHLCNCNVAVEGIDVPACSAVVVCRVTKSVLRAAQMFGRGVRPLPGINGIATADERKRWIADSPKSDCLVVGFYGSLKDLDLVVKVEDVIADGEDEEVRERAKHKTLHQETPITDAIREAREEIMRERECERVVKQIRDEEEARRLTWFVPEAIYQTEEVQTFGQRHPSQKSTPENRGRLGSITPAQARRLIALGHAPHVIAKWSKSQAGWQINHHVQQHEEPNYKRLGSVGQEWKWLIRDKERAS